MNDKLKQLLIENPRNLDDKCDCFLKCTHNEYKELALFSLSELCTKHGNFEKCRTDNAGWAAHHITKAIFEEQDIFDSYEDEDFIQQAIAICPYYIKRYLN